MYFAGHIKKSLICLSVITVRALRTEEEFKSSTNKNATLYNYDIDEQGNRISGTMRSAFIPKPDYYDEGEEPTPDYYHPDYIIDEDIVDDTDYTSGASGAASTGSMYASGAASAGSMYASQPASAGSMYASQPASTGSMYASQPMSTGSMYASRPATASTGTSMSTGMARNYNKPGLARSYGGTGLTRSYDETGNYTGAGSTGGYYSNPANTGSYYGGSGMAGNPSQTYPRRGMRAR